MSHTIMLNVVHIQSPCTYIQPGQGLKQAFDHQHVSQKVSVFISTHF